MSDYISENGVGEHSEAVLDYMLHTEPNSQRAIDEAAKLGMDVVFPENNQLQLDIDNDEAYGYMNSVLDVIELHWNVVDFEEHPSKSGLPKRHVTITLGKEISDTERVLLQACLGSDRKRELLSYLQVLNGDAHPILFIEKRQLALPPAPPIEETLAKVDYILKDEDIPY